MSKIKRMEKKEQRSFGKRTEIASPHINNKATLAFFVLLISNKFRIGFSLERSVVFFCVQDGAAKLQLMFF
jgi:hypothetical protein